VTRRVPTGRAAAFSSPEETIGPDDEAARTIAAWRDRLARREAVDFEADIAARPAIAARLGAALATLRRLDPAFAVRAAPSPLVGTAIGPYRIERRLGAGGMGEVYLATLVRDAAGLAAGGRVALKLVHAHLLERKGFVERFEREARLGLSIRHENVVRTLDAALLDVAGTPRHALAMEHVEGETLRAMLDELERLPEGLCRHVGREVARGLEAIHAAGAVHRDLKPENVIVCAPRADEGVAKPEDGGELGGRVARAGHAPVTREHVVKVMDLGVARLAAEAARLSATGVFAGSIHYAAPEQFRRRGDDVDARADLFSLGIVLYELATGAHPFPADDVASVMRKLVEETPRKASVLNPQLSPFFEEVVATLLAKDPRARFASAAELARVLDEGEASAWWQAHAQALRAATRRPLRRVRVPRETALYGRAQELATLRALFDRAKAGDGQVLLVEGEAGIGKSRLVDELVGLLHQSGEDVNFLFGSYPPGGAATASGAFSVAYREHFGDDEAAIRTALPQTPLLVPAFAALLRGDVAPNDVERLTKDSLQTVFVHATRSLAAERPTIVLVDDLHFAPEEGRSLFASLALAAPGHRVLLVGCARPSLDEKWSAQLASHAQTTRLALARLGPKELVHLLRDALSSDRLAEELGVLIAVKSDGNPFFVFELLRGLRDGQFLRQREDGTWETAQIIRDIQVPSSIAELVQQRVADLPAEDKDLLDVAACCGFEFDPLVVGEALGRGRIAVLQALGRLERRRRLVRSAGRRFVFDHHQVQEALYAGISELLREEYHALLGAAVESHSRAAAREPKDIDGALCVEMADHFLKGAQGPRALRYLDAALTHCETNFLNESAVRLAGGALGVKDLVTRGERVELLLRAAARLDSLGRRDAERAALDEATALANEEDDVPLRARTRCAIGRHLWCTSRYDESLIPLREGRDLARAAGDRRSEADATGGLGSALCSLGRAAEGQEQLERSLVLAREGGDVRAEARATQSIGNVDFHLGRFDAAREHYERAVSLAQDVGDRMREGSARCALAGVLMYLGDFDAARVHDERALALSKELGHRLGETMTSGDLGQLCATLGLLADARPRFERCLALSQEIGDRRGEAIATADLGQLFESLGRLGEARRLVERSRALAQEIGDRRQEGFTLQYLADIATEEGDAAAAELHYSEALALRRELGQRDGEADTLRARGSLFSRLGRGGDAIADLLAAVTLARELKRPELELLAACQLARLSDGAVPAAVAALAAHEGRVGQQARMEARFLLWNAMSRTEHLAEAKRLLDHLVEHAPPECREPMLANVRLHREIAAAAREHGIG
jgi:serine/threonine protein kinase/tetratricopeptide (TPR) repeat protein